MNVANILPLVAQAVIVAVIFFVVAFMVFETTDIGKGLTRYLASVIPGLSWIAVRNFGSFALALALSLIAVFYPGSNLGSLLNQLATQAGLTVDSNFVNALTSILIALWASAQQNSGKMPTPLASSRTAK